MSQIDALLATLEMLRPTPAQDWRAEPYDLSNIFDDYDENGIPRLIGRDKPVVTIFCERRGDGREMHIGESDAMVFKVGDHYRSPSGRDWIVTELQQYANGPIAIVEPEPAQPANDRRDAATLALKHFDRGW